MERVGSNRPEVIKAYVADALRHLESIMPEKTTGTKYDVVEDQLLYNLPASMIKLLGVYRRYDDEGKYKRIGLVQNIRIAEAASSTAAADDVDIIVV